MSMTWFQEGHFFLETRCSRASFSCLDADISLAQNSTGYHQQAFVIIRTRRHFLTKDSFPCTTTTFVLFFLSIFEQS